MILEENKLLKFIQEEVSKPDTEESKEEHQIQMIKAKRIIVDSIRDHLIPFVSSRKTPKDMYVALSNLFEENNINRNVNLRNYLKSLKMAKGESVHDYFSRIHQLMEQIEAIGEKIDSEELAMTAMNSLTRALDAFIQTVCRRKEKSKFEEVWEECIQEEARVANRDELLKENDHALAAHARRGKGRPPFRRAGSKESLRKAYKGNHKNKDYSNYKCYTCNKVGHIARNCLEKKGGAKKKFNKRRHAHAVEEESP